MLDHSVTVKADSVDEAIRKGLAELGIGRDQATIRVINEGKKGFLGFGKQDAIVEIARDSDLSLSDLTQELEDKEAAEVTNQVEDSSIRHLDRQEETLTVGVEQDSDSSELITVEEDLNQGNDEVNLTNTLESKPESEDAEADVNGHFGHTKVKSNEDPDFEEDAGESSDNNRQPLSLEETKDQVARYLEAVIREYGAQAHIEASDSGKNVIFDIDTDKSGLVIGKHGKIINSLQILAQTLLLSLHHRHMNVVLNVGNYRDRRANVLEQMAEQTAQEVMDTKQTVILDALPAYERKQIHAHLAKYDNIQTHSEGKEPNRYLVVEYVKDHVEDEY